MLGRSNEAYIGDGDGVALIDHVITDIVKHVLDEHGALNDNAIYGSVRFHPMDWRTWVRPESTYRLR